MFLGTERTSACSQQLGGLRWGPRWRSGRDVLVLGSWIKYSFLHSFGRVTWAGMKGYMKVSKFGRHHCASVSPISHSSLTPSPENCEPTGASRSLSRFLKPSSSSSSCFR
jgi:hypothetical protein